MKKRWLILAVFLPLLGACVYDYEAELTGDQYTVVIEGDIIVGGTTTVSFSRLNPEVLGNNTNSNAELNSYYRGPGGWGLPVNFIARVEGEDGTVVEGNGLGGLCSLDTRSLNPGVRYRLSLDDLENGMHYTSQWETVETAPVIDSLSYSINNNQLDVRITFHSDGSTPYYCLVYDEQWEYHAWTTSYYRYVPQGAAEPDGGYVVFPEPEKGWGDRYGRIFEVWDPYPNYTCWNSSVAGVSSVITTGAMVSNKMVDYVMKTFTDNDRKVSVAYRPIVSLRMISKESFAYWESLDKASTQTGDLFSPIPSLLRGNITNEDNPNAQVIGYVGVSQQVVADRLIKASEILFYHQPIEISEWLKERAIGSGKGGVWAVQMHSQYTLGNRPWKLEWPEGDDKEGDPYYVWIPQICMDCRTQGGDTTKPEGWPE